MVERRPRRSGRWPPFPQGRRGQHRPRAFAGRGYLHGHGPPERVEVLPRLLVTGAGGEHPQQVLVQLDGALAVARPTLRLGGVEQQRRVQLQVGRPPRIASRLPRSPRGHSGGSLFIVQLGRGFIPGGDLGGVVSWARAGAPASSAAATTASEAARIRPAASGRLPDNQVKGPTMDPQSLHEIPFNDSSSRSGIAAGFGRINEEICLHEALPDRCRSRRHVTQSPLARESGGRADLMLPVARNRTSAQPGAGARVTQVRLCPQREDP